jgi:hypothetical protein
MCRRRARRVRQLELVIQLGIELVVGLGVILVVRILGILGLSTR